MKTFRYAESSANIQIFAEITEENRQYDINKNPFEIFTDNKNEFPFVMTRNSTHNSNK